MGNNFTKSFKHCALRIMLVAMLVSVCDVALAAPRVAKFKMSSAPLERVFDELERITGVKFLYNADLVSGKTPITVEASDAPLEQILDAVLKPRGLEYSIMNNQVVIRRSPNAPPDGPKANNVLISGQVVDLKGAPLAGATVVVEGTSVGTTADARGQFSFGSPKAKGFLKITYVGYKPNRVEFSSDRSVVVKLAEDVSMVDEVTVIGYGVRKKREVVGAISSIKADDIKDIPAPSLETLLQGRMAGVGVTQQSGSPGGGSANMAIRGYNSLLEDEAGYKSAGAPLYVIDGVPVHSFTSPVTGTNTLAEIDPSTIESVEVLKDAASAAIYGSRAANGVILITTKKGRDGRSQFSANFSYSVANLPQAPEQLGGRMEREHYMKMIMATKTAYYDKGAGQWRYPSSYEEAKMNGVDFDIFWNRGQGMPASDMMAPVQDSLNPFYNNSTNWYKYIFRPGTTLNANIQSSGGTATMNYLVGGGVYRETGIMPGSDFVRGNVMTNISVKPVKNLTLDSRLYLAYTDRSRGKGGGAGGFYESLTIDPQYTSSLLPGGGAVESKMLQRLNGQSESNTSYRLRGNMVLRYEIIKGLNISTSAALDFNQTNQNFFIPAELDMSGYHESRSQGDVMRDMLLSNENLLNYNFSVRKHEFDLLAGLAFDANKIWSIGGYGLGGPSEDIEYVGGTFPDQIYDPVSDYYRALMRYKSDFTETAMTSYFGRVAYNYDQKYMLEATMRRDGSSVFGPEVRWATFPSVAAGWAFSEENFMRWAWWLDFGKFRASWGRTGSQFSIPYLAMGLMEPGYKFDGVQGMRPQGVLNRSLKWEESDQLDLGLDLDMFDHRFTMSVDYYRKYTRDLIYRVLMPGDMYGEGNIQWRNAMEVSNDGVELEAKVDIIRNKAVTWRSRLNVSQNWNRFCKSYSNADLKGQIVIGKGMSGIWLFKDEGMIQVEGDVPFYYDEQGQKHILSPDGDDANFFRPGMRKIADLDGDGQITEDDMYYAGSALPTLYGGWANEIRWKDFDLSLLFTFTIGRNMINSHAWQTVQGQTSGSRPIFGKFEPSDFWQKPGDDTKYPAYGIYSSGAMQYSGRLSSNLEKVSFCKLKQLTLGYTIPERISKKLRMSSIRAFVTGENVFTLSNYSGLDPEVVSIHSGVDTGTSYPLSRKWTLGLTVNF